MSKTLKPFDLEAAKRGEPLVTRDGRAVSEFHHFTTEATNKPCIAIINGNVSWTRTNGLVGDGYQEDNDLFMAPKKRTVYVQIFDKAADVDAPCLKAVAFENERDAEINLGTTTWGVLVKAFPIEIEE